MREDQLIIYLRRHFLTFLLLFPLTLHATIIESTIGTAVVNDATAAYYNPAALTLLKSYQIVTLGSTARFRTNFMGQATQIANGLTQFGNSSSQTQYYLPSLYFGIPYNNQFTFGFGVLYNSFHKDLEDGTLLRYVQAENHISSVDFIPAIGMRLNNCLAIGAGLSLSYVSILLRPVTGLPSLSIPDSISRNQSRATSWGGDVGLLYTPMRGTLIGFNYHSGVTYSQKGSSQFEGKPSLSSNNYRFKFWTPARSILTVAQFVNEKLGLIGTIEYIEWHIFKNINLHNVVTQIGSQTTILQNAIVPFHLHNSWLLTLGSNYRVTQEWIVRFAGSYVQSPANGQYQLSNGDSIIVGISTGYDINKNFTIDGGYAHAFIKKQNINIVTNRNIINGVNKASRDAFSLKLTINI